MESSNRKWWILTAMCLLTAILNIDVSGLNIAIPVIAHEFHASLANMQWVISAYVLMSAVLQILGGRLGDAHGHRKIFLIGTATFVIGSLGAGISTDEGMLIAFRVLQGISLGIAYPMTIVLTFAAFPKSQQGFALSFIIASMGIFLAIGPPLGGIFVDYLSWRWIFYINVPIGILTFIIAYIFCKPHKAEEKRYIDYKGAIFLVLGLIGITLAINELQNWGFSSAAFWSSLIIGALLLVALYFICRRQSYPIIEFRLFKIRNFTLNNIIRLIVQLVFIPVIFFVPIYLQNIVGISAVYSGLMMLFLTAIIAILSPIAGKWIDRVGDRVPNIFSMICFALACLLLASLDQEPHYAVLAIALCLVGAAIAVTSVSTVTGAVSVCPENQHGAATGIIFTTAWLGCALGVAIMGSILAMNSESFLQKHIKEASTVADSQLETLERASKGVASYKALPPKAGLLARESFVHGFRISMITFMFLSLIGMVLSFFLKRHKPQHVDDVPPM